MKKKRLVVDMPEELHTVLKLRAAYDGIPMSLWVTNVIRDKISDPDWKGYKLPRSTNLNDPEPT